MWLNLISLLEVFQVNLLLSQSWWNLIVVASRYCWSGTTLTFKWCADFRSCMVFSKVVKIRLLTAWKESEFNVFCRIWHGTTIKKVVERFVTSAWVISCACRCLSNDSQGCWLHIKHPVLYQQAWNFILERVMAFSFYKGPFQLKNLKVHGKLSKAKTTPTAGVTTMLFQAGQST